MRSAKRCSRATRRAARKAGASSRGFQGNEKVTGVIFNQVKGGFTVISTARWRSCRAAKSTSADPRRDPAHERCRSRSRFSRWIAAAAYRGVAPHRAGRDPRRAAPGAGAESRGGQVIDGVVKNITDYRRLRGSWRIDGLLHVTDHRLRRVNHPTEVLTIGQQVKVKIIKINHETHRIRSA